MGRSLVLASKKRRWSVPMGLHAKLFVGDARLEAASVSDPAHITPGAVGPHVGKIQTALIVLDKASIAYDEAQRGLYGPSTIKAVLAFKHKRDIINRNYQTQADNIVGKMTMARLDQEMQAWEGAPHASVRIWPISHRRYRPPRAFELTTLLHRAQRVSPALASGPRTVAAPHFVPGSVMALPRRGVGTFVVADGAGGTLRNFDPDLVTVEVATFIEWAPTDKGHLAVTTDLQTFKVTAGGKLGEAEVGVSTPAADSATLTIVVTKPFPGPPQFQPAKPHGHRPSGQWRVIQANPKSSGLSETLCRMSDDPQKVMDAAKLAMNKTPLALEHLDWYLTKGNGGDFVEDENIRHWINQDSKIRARLKTEIFPLVGKPRTGGHFAFSRNDYDKKTDNFALSFGSIDRIDFEVDFADDTVRVWFQDRYEFHPVFPGLYSAEPGDFQRADNCVHAAAVEMKSRGAQDYWMKGQTAVALSLIAKP